MTDGLSEIAEGARPRPQGGQGGNASSRDSRPALAADDQLIAFAVSTPKPSKAINAQLGRWTASTGSPGITYLLLAVKVYD